METADRPHMIVMNRNGKMCPGTVGPPVANTWLNAGASSFGLAMSTPPTSSAIVPIFRKLDR
jgi:hypothetical protein